MKERLTGAILLVALIVVLVPELLNGPLRPAAKAHGPLPPAEAPPLRSVTINFADEPRGGSGALEMQPARSSPPAPAAETGGPPRAAQPAATAPAAAAPAVAASAAQSAPVTPPTTRKPEAARPAPAPPTPAPTAAEPRTTAAPPAAASTATAASGSGYVVQLGSFASRANAERLARQVRGQGFTVSVSRGTAGRHLYRVQVGPARERAAAEQLAAKLRSQGHAGAVVAK